MSAKHKKKVKIKWGRFLSFILCVAVIGAAIVFIDRSMPKSAEASKPANAAASAKEDSEVRKQLSKPLQSESEDCGPAPVLEPLLIRCVGDIMAHMPQVNAAKTASGYDFSENYKYVKKYFKEADLMMGNLETTFSGDGKYSGYPGFDSPEILAKNVKDAGVDVAIFANNHMMDSGLNGAKNTVKVLKQNNFLAVVGAREKTSDPRSAVVEVNGIKVGIVAYTYETRLVNGRRTMNGSYMAADAPNFINSFRYSGGTVLSEDLSSIKSEIKWCRKNGADIVICYFHWGTEYRQSPDAADQALAKYAAENGADIIFASHPHVLQPIKTIKVEAALKQQEERPAAAAYGELVRPSKAQAKATWTKTVPVFYSMGNFVSNQRYETLNDYGPTKGEKSRLTEQGMIANVRISYNRQTGRIHYDEISCIPTWVDKYTAGGKVHYFVVPLIGDYTKNASLTASGHVTRAKSALTAITNLVGSKYIYKEK